MAAFACVLLVLIVWNVSSQAQEEEIISKWAQQFGQELWDLGKSVTKLADVKSRYKTMNTRVEHKDGESLLNSIIDSVGRMLALKMDAIQCIMSAAEEAAEQFTYEDLTENYTFYNSKRSRIDGIDEEIAYADNNRYETMYLSEDNHFYSIPVNTTHSSVHVPTNVYDKSSRVLSSIQWSESLNDVFVQNYNSDPALTWQYFGDATGIMRSFPATQWNQDPDLFDCRTRFWYIEAATCTKDVIILMDNSGSMKGMRNKIAQLTVNGILDSLGNNDYVNVFNYSETTDEVIPCFQDMLVQATLENVNKFKSTIKDIIPDGHANLTFAFTKSFELLQEYREMRGCGNDTEGMQCNQAIMLVTDGVSGNHTEVFEAHNWIDNGTYIPVRVFTFLVGREVTKVREIQWMACLNRGYYVHIHSMNEVKEQVLKYIDVIARPLVLQELVHPVMWTHAYVDTTDPKLGEWLWDVMDNPDKKNRLIKHELNKEMYFSQHKEDRLYVKEVNEEEEVQEIRTQEYRLMTSVSMPAFDKRPTPVNESRQAKLLGVAGTDVPLEDIARLTFPHKVGVNGYPFIVTNNGYILLHPDLRPVYQGILKDNYNSIDLIEVELHDDGRGPRELSPEIYQLREAIVNHTSGKVEDLQIKFHYDDMRRVGVEKRDYYFAPLTGTPFTMGIALPKDYGSLWIKVRDEIIISKQSRTPLVDLFKGSDWRIHPRWLYCKYHYTQLHPFDSPEEELLHFLQKLMKRDWQWSEQYIKVKRDIVDFDFWSVETSNETVNCNKPYVGEQEYYCDRDLMQLLIFDAKISQPYFKDSKVTHKNKEAEELFNEYNVSLKFMATHSGLTRWKSFAEPDQLNYWEFGDFYSEAIEEPWYKSAVLQHQIDPDSFVFTVPFDSGLREDTTVTGSHAIFHRDGGLVAPASVVGLQFLHSSLYSRFMNITSKSNCHGCSVTCASEELDCFVLDHNGYVLISETQNDTGRFFGEIEGAVMEAMKFENIFRKIPIYDYQALCVEEVVWVASAANYLMTPLYHLTCLVHWVFSQLIWLLFESNIHHLFYGGWVSAVPSPFQAVEEVIDYDYEIDEEAVDDTSEDDMDGDLGKDGFQVPMEIRMMNTSAPCDQKTNIYLLQQHLLLREDGYKSATPTNCSRPFFVKRIPHSNLLLVVVNTMYPSCYRRLESSAKEIHYNNTEYPCQKLLLNYLPRRRLSGCFSEHPLEEEITLCGHCSKTAISLRGLMVCWMALVLAHLAPR